MNDTIQVIEIVRKECACRLVIHERVGPPGPHIEKWEYCRLHANAPKMYKAIRRAINDIEKNINPLLEGLNIHPMTLILEDLKDAIEITESDE